MNADSPTPLLSRGPHLTLYSSKPHATEKSFAAGGDHIASRPKLGSNPCASQPSTPERKHLRYPAEAPPTAGEERGKLAADIFVPIPGGVGRQDLDDLSELLEDPSLTAEDLTEILETLGALSAEQARSESRAAPRTKARMHACIVSCVANLFYFHRVDSFRSHFLE